jgi:hypothetical protein
MKFLIWCIIGVVIGGALAWSGIVVGKIQYSTTKIISGAKARLIGLVCLVIALICLILSAMGALAINESMTSLESAVTQ